MTEASQVPWIIQSPQVQRKHSVVAALFRQINAPAPRQTAPAASYPVLSRRQRQTLDLLLAGQSEKEIASGMRISIHTVHRHVKIIYRRHGASTRSELLARYIGQDRAG
jgi:DNA-binding CsgD family transcriptional regulator